MTTIDGRILDTDNRFHDYCLRNKIKDPFREGQERFSKKVEDENGRNYWIIDTDDSPEEVTWRTEWAKRRDEYLRLSHTFRLWDFHFWMTRTAFERHLRWSKEFADTSIYMPCDCAERQCSMKCAYFSGECPRQKEELRAPEILGFEGRWEYDDKDEFE